jgi:hypothetical protein
MSSHLKLAARLLGVLAVSIACSTKETASEAATLRAVTVDSAAGAAAPAAAPLGPGVLRLRDNAWNTVKVEVREGNFQNCDQNGSLETRTMHRGETWPISSYNIVCWRRDSDPDHPNGTWTGWTQQSVFADHTYDANV